VRRSGVRVLVIINIFYCPPLDFFPITPLPRAMIITKHLSNTGIQKKNKKNKAFFSLV
jgi:hypothetical protein